MVKNTANINKIPPIKLCGYFIPPHTLNNCKKRKNTQNFKKGITPALEGGLINHD